MSLLAGQFDLRPLLSAQSGERTTDQALPIRMPRAAILQTRKLRAATFGWSEMRDTIRLFDRDEVHSVVQCRGRFGSNGLATAGAEALARALGNLPGDFALLQWDPRQRKVRLARSLLSTCPLFFRHEGAKVTVASLPSMLLEKGRGRLRLDNLAHWYAANVGTSVECLFEKVEKVHPGTVVTVGEHGVEVLHFGDEAFPPIEQELSLDDAASQLRAAMEAAVADAIHDQGSVTGSLLSAGRDSTLVTALARQRLAGAGERLHAFTYAPAPDPRLAALDIFYDEEPQASATVARLGNIWHHLVRPTNFKAAAVLRDLAPLTPVPLGNPLSLHWWEGIQRSAAQQGRGVVLTGSMGNQTVSDGGIGFLADLIAERRIFHWLRVMPKAARHDGTSLLTLLNTSFGAGVPQRFYRFLQARTGRLQPPIILPFVRGPLRQAIVAAHQGEIDQPFRSHRERRREMLSVMELADLSPDLRHGLSMRDPTADLRVLQSVHRVPSTLLASPYAERPLYVRAFGDLVPSEVACSKRRAYQSVDWNLAYDRNDLLRLTDEVESNPVVTELIDVAAVRQALHRWPQDRAATTSELIGLGQGTLRALTLATFIEANVDDYR